MITLEIHRPNRRYAAIPNDLLRNKTLSLEARGMMAMLMTYSDGLAISREKIVETSGFGRDKFERVIRELRDVGYLELVPVRGDGGKMMGRKWIVHDTAAEHRTPENPGFGDRIPGFHGGGQPGPGESGIIERPENKKDHIEEMSASHDADLFSEKEELPTTDFFEDFWQAYPKNRKRADKRTSRTRFANIVAGKVKGLEHYPTGDQLVLAAKNYAASNPDRQYVPAPEVWLSKSKWIGWLMEPTDPEPPSRFRKYVDQQNQHWGEKR